MDDTEVGILDMGIVAKPGGADARFEALLATQRQFAFKRPGDGRHYLFHQRSPGEPDEEKADDGHHIAGARVDEEQDFVEDGPWAAVRQCVQEVHRSIPLPPARAGA